jgi:site-specific DNA-methyltransferase (adenine-specific)
VIVSSSAIRIRSRTSRRAPAAIRVIVSGSRSDAGSAKTGYPTPKPAGVLRRIVAASSRRGGWCLDPFAGSGTLGAVCRELGRRFVLVDSSPDAVAVMRDRLGSPATDVEAGARAGRT